MEAQRDEVIVPEHTAGKWQIPDLNFELSNPKVCAPSSASECSRLDSRPPEGNACFCRFLVV